MKKFIAATAWWVSLSFTTLGVAALLVKGIIMRAIPVSFVALSYGIITILALLLNGTSAALKSKAGDVFEKLMLAATPLLYWVALIQTRFRAKPDLLR